MTAGGKQENRGPKQEISLQRYFLDTLEAHGAVVDTPGYALLEALLPSEVAAALELPEEVQLAFDYEVACENPEAELVAYGSPLLDRAVGLGLKAGRIARKVAAVSTLNVPSDISAKIKKRLEFVRCRPPVLRSAGVVRSEAVLFNFRTRFISDEKQENIYPILVDTAVGQEVNYQLPWLQTMFFVTGDPGIAALTPADHCGYAKAYEAAKEALPGAITQDLGEFQARMQHFLQDEAKRLASFYRQTMVEIRQRIHRQDANEERRQRLEKKLPATQADFYKRVEDIRSKYRIMVEAEVDSVTVYVWPKVKLTLDIEHKNMRTPMTLYYNLAAGALELPLCLACHRPNTAVYFDSRGRFLCPSCAGT
ncbi:MAG: hypothetical protein D9V47_01000 [Clostridia bacterium]|nr:MAG: hypothetical protein D9V47_01000 [Clostridia bacterium]